MFGKCCENMSCKECIELTLKIIFVAVFTYGVLSAVCCAKSCKNATQSVVTQCGINCVKPCCAK